MSTSQAKTVNDVFYEPLRTALLQARHTRTCRELPDPVWLEMCVDRVIAQEPSGRGYVQSVMDRHQRDIPLSTYFDANATPRRLRFIREISEDVGAQLDHLPEALAGDPFRDVTSLQDYELFAGDGHYLEAATHDKKIDGDTFPSGHFFGMNMRTQRLFSMACAQRGGTRKREHDMHVLKRLDGKGLRRGTPVGRKVIWVWDRAGIDASQWQKWKQGNGVYFISRTKENMKLGLIGLLPYDDTAPENSGVQGFELVSVGNQALRRVLYRCPETGATLSFLSSLTQVEPGVIAALYRARWGIEKIFDETKTKLREKKSWGARETTKHIQAEAITLTHNLMMIFEHRIQTEHGLTPKDDHDKRMRRLRELMEKASRLGQDLPPMICRAFQRASQRGVRFIRWLRNKIDCPDPLSESLASLRRIWGLE